MKRFAFIVSFVFMAIVALPIEASAQFDLSNLFGGSSSSSKKSPYQTLAENAPSANSVIGVWKYDNVGIDYLGTNSFADVAIDQVEDYAREELRNAGIMPGCFSIKLNSNGTASFIYEDYVYSGKYTYDSSNARFRIEATADNGKTISCGGFLKMTSSGKLVVMFKAEDAIRAFRTVAPDADDSTMFEMVEDVVESFSGIYLSLRCMR